MRMLSPRVHFALASVLLSACFVTLQSVSPPAQAASAATASTTVNYGCELVDDSLDVTVVDANLDYQVTTTYPTDVTNGSTFNLLWSINEMPLADLADTGVITTTTADVNLVHQDNRSVTVGSTSGPSDPGDIQNGQPYPGTTALKIPIKVVSPAGGETVKITASDVVVDIVSDDLTQYGYGLAGAEVTCTPTASTSPVLATINVVGTAPACATSNTCTGAQTFVGSRPPGICSSISSPEVVPTLAQRSRRSRVLRSSRLYLAALTLRE